MSDVVTSLFTLLSIQRLHPKTRFLECRVNFPQVGYYIFIFLKMCFYSDLNSICLLRRDNVL